MWEIISSFGDGLKSAKELWILFGVIVAMKIYGWWVKFKKRV